MTDFAERLVRDEPVFRQLIGEFGIRTALDAGAGTGLHSLILARLGVEVTAVDVSGAMLHRLEQHAAAMGLQIRTVGSALEDLAESKVGPVDAVFCLGNTISHLLSDEDLLRALNGFAYVLRPDGVLVIQLPNFERIIRRGQRIQNVRERNGTIYVRFYDLDGDRVRFNVLTLRRESGAMTHALNTVTLQPLRADRLVSLLGESGFSNQEVFGGLSKQGFVPAESQELVVIAKKEGGRT